MATCGHKAAALTNTQNKGAAARHDERKHHREGQEEEDVILVTGTLHKGKDDHGGVLYARTQNKENTDPRCDGGLQLELQRDMMTNFRKQKGRQHRRFGRRW